MRCHNSLILAVYRHVCRFSHALQLYWHVWTNITEKSFGVSVSGGGKSELDGMFGRFANHLRISVRTRPRALLAACQYSVYLVS